MENDFVSWLTAEMNQRGWTNTEMARRAGVVQSTISLLLSRKTQPGNDLCRGIARALRIPAEDVFRRAGLLPPLPDDVEQQQLARLYDYYKRLPARVRDEIVEYAAFKYEREGKREYEKDKAPE